MYRSGNSSPPKFQLAFQPLNLKRNPFGEPTPAERAALATCGPVHTAPGEVVQLLGDQGLGKTTRLLVTAHRADHAAYWRALEGTPPPAPSQGRWLLCVDEVDLLPKRALRRLLRTWPSLLLATHVDLTPWSPRPIRTIRLEPLSLEGLLSLVRARLEWARFGPGPVPEVPRRLLEELLGRHRGNPRAIEDDLYEYFERLKRGAEPAGS